MTLRAALFGALELRSDQRSVTVTSPLIAALLGCLALDGSNGTPLAREEVIERLWPDRSAKKARHLLSDTLHRARTMLGDLAACVVADRQSLRLVGVTVDVREFELLARSTEPRDWQAAIALYRGDVLPGVDGEWIDERRHNLRNRYLGLLERLTRALETNGATNDALEAALLWSRADPLNEQAHGAVMRCYAHLDQRSAALHQYHFLRSLLWRHLQIEPLPETVELAARIAANLPLARGAPPQPPAPDRGEDESRTIRTVLLAHADAPLGRRLTDADRVSVRWTIDAGAEDARLRRTTTPAEVRRHRILRLLAEAAAQGAAPTDQDLADALGVTRRTIETDMAALRCEGIPIETRRRSRQR
jgi:DNA-binding SARP family transcriptional activator/biotin operon repressor